MQSPFQHVADRHREFAATFSSLVDGVDDLSCPTPVPEWDVRALVEHMIWFHDFVHGGSPFGWTRRVDPAVDPIGAWREQCSAVQNILDDPAQAESPFFHPMASGMSLAEATDRFYVADVAMHSWDLARASGQALVFDDAYARTLLEGMRANEEMIRASGQFGTAQAVDPEADVMTQLMAFVGRDPQFGIG